MIIWRFTVRRERIEKIINVLSLVFTDEEIMSKQPEELEQLFYLLINNSIPLTKKYLQKMYDTKKYKKSHNTLPRQHPF